MRLAFGIGRSRNCVAKWKPQARRGGLSGAACEKSTCHS